MNFNKNPFLNRESKIASNMVKVTANDTSSKIASIKENMKKAKDNGLKINNNNMSSQDKINIIKELEGMRK